MLSVHERTEMIINERESGMSSLDRQSNNPFILTPTKAISYYLPKNYYCIIIYYIIQS